MASLVLAKQGERLVLIQLLFLLLVGDHEDSPLLYLHALKLPSPRLS
jgi:hypothetical protein